jgi:hypothetical protein
VAWRVLTRAVLTDTESCTQMVMKCACETHIRCSENRAVGGRDQEFDVTSLLVGYLLVMKCACVQRALPCEVVIKSLVQRLYWWGI